MRKKVLVLAGGGVFGAVTSTLLSGHNPHEDFDVFAGSSVGSLLAGLYASGKSGFEVHSSFVKMAGDVFPKRPWWKGPKVFGAKYDGRLLEDALSKLLPPDFGDISKPLFVPAYNMLERKVKVYDNVTSLDSGLRGWVPLRASAAAPTYFTIPHWFVDGGLVENIPVMCCLTGISRKLGWDWRDIDVLAVGTGRRKPAAELNLDRINNWWTSVQWLPRLIEFLTECNEQASVAWATTLADSGHLGSFTYYDPVTLDNDWKMDEPERIPEAVRRAERFTMDFHRVYGKFIGE